MRRRKAQAWFSLSSSALLIKEAVFQTQGPHGSLSCHPEDICFAESRRLVRVKLIVYVKTLI